MFPSENLVCMKILLLTVVPLIRTTRSDWLAWERERQSVELSAAAFQ